MADTFITPNWVSTDVAMFWSNNIKGLNLASMTYGSEWKDKPDGAQLGHTVQQRIPQRFRVKRGQALQQQPILNQTVPISLTDQLQVAMGWSSADDALAVQEVREMYTMPAGQALSNECDRFFLDTIYRSINFSVGTPGQSITNNETWTDAVAILRAYGVPEDLLSVTDPIAQSKLTANNLTQFNPTEKIGKIFNKGFYGFGAFGVDEWAWDSNMPTFTTSVFTASTPVVSGGNQSGSTILLSGLGTYAFVEGQKFTVDGVNGVNPISFVDTGMLYQFTVAAPISGSSTVTLTLTQPVIADTNSPLQTVTALPANGAAVNFVGATGSVGATMTATTSKISIIANNAAFAFVSADLPVKLAGAVAGRTPGAKTDRVSIRYVDQYNIQTDQLPRRMDAMVGAASILPYFGLIAYGR